MNCSRSLPSFQHLDPLACVDHSIEIGAVAPRIGVRVCPSDGYAPNFIEDALIAQDYRRRETGTGMLDQNLRALRGLVGRAGRRQPQPARVLLLLRKQAMISSSEISVIEGDDDIRGADREA